MSEENTEKKPVKKQPKKESHVLLRDHRAETGQTKKVGKKGKEKIVPIYREYKKGEKIELTEKGARAFARQKLIKLSR